VYIKEPMKSLSFPYVVSARTVHTLQCRSTHSLHGSELETLTSRLKSLCSERL